MRWIILVFQEPYCQLESYLRALGSFGSFTPSLRSVGYTALWRRATKLKLGFSIAVDVGSIRVKITNSRDCIRKKYDAEHRGWIGISIVVYIDARRPVALEITDEITSDHRVVGKLLKDVEMDISDGYSLR